MKLLLYDCRCVVLCYKEPKHTLFAFCVACVHVLMLVFVPVVARLEQRAVLEGQLHHLGEMGASMVIACSKLMTCEYVHLIAKIYQYNAYMISYICSVILKL